MLHRALSNGLLGGEYNEMSPLKKTRKTERESSLTELTEEAVNIEQNASQGRHGVS